MILRQFFEIDGVRYTAEVSNKSGATLYCVDQAKEIFDDSALYDYRDWSVVDNEPDWTTWAVVGKVK